MKSRIIIGVDISDPNVCYETLDKPRKYVDLDGLDVKILGFTPYNKWDDTREMRVSGSFVGLYEYEGGIIPVDTIVGSLEDFGYVFAVIWCSEGVMKCRVGKHFLTGVETSYCGQDFDEECSGFYYCDPRTANETHEYYVGNRYKAAIYKELWSEDESSLLSPPHKSPLLWDDVVYVIETIIGDR